MDEKEKDLVVLLKKRDEKAFDTFFRKYQHKIFSLALRLLGNYQEAEDITQEIFITVFKTIENFREESSISSWLFTLAVNHCKNRIKYLARRIHPESLSDSPEKIKKESAMNYDRIKMPDKIIETREIEELITKALEKLDDDHKTILLLREMQELSYSEIAEIMKIEEGTVKSKLHRARCAFYSEFKRLTGGDDNKSSRKETQSDETRRS